jgi:hypothetical protein
MAYILKCGRCSASVTETPGNKLRCGITGLYVAKTAECHCTASQLAEAVAKLAAELRRQLGGA